MSKRTLNFQSDQIISAFINQINNNRYLRFQEAILEVEKELGIRLVEQDVKMLEALTHIQGIRDFVANPEGILGSISTKHGEIAEQVEVGIRNARDTLRGVDITATFESVGRTAPEDYRIGEMLYQSKFINGSRNTLDHVLEHMKKYDDFRLGTNTKYHIPRDQYEVIEKVIKGENVDGLHSRTIIALKSKIKEIEDATGSSFFDKIEPGESAYSEIQINTVGYTLNTHETALNNENEKIKEAFNDEAKGKTEALQELKNPTMGEAVKAGVIGAGGSATMKFVFCVYKKYKDENKHIAQYTEDDWKEVGLEVGKGAVKGGISGTGIYVLTNFAYMPAPVAGGYVTATYSAANILNQYQKGELDFEDFLIESEAVCVEAGLTMTCALIGQAVIPIPVVGAIVGSVIGSMISGPVMEKAKDKLNEEELKMISEYNIRCQEYSMQLETEERAYFDEVIERFKTISELEAFIFDESVNTSIRLVKSADLAKQYGVEDHLILRSVKDVDSLFM